jgi:hypothetical protein
MKIKLFDENLIGQPGLSRYIDPKTNWEREPENYDVGIYVDRMCFDSPRDESKTNCAWLIEPPIINGENYQNIIKNKENFKYIFTHHKNLLNQSENVVYVPHGGTWMREDDINIHDKSKLVSCIFSYKNWNPYHRMRFRVYDRLKDDSRVDFYGSGCEKPIEYKTEALKDYMFSVAIENDNSDTYFTEKLTDCFAMGTVPVYYGSRKVVEKYFDPAGVIFLEDDATLSTLSVEKYQSMMPAIERNFQLAINLPLAEDYMWENYLKNLY